MIILMYEEGFRRKIDPVSCKLPVDRKRKLVLTAGRVAKRWRTGGEPKSR